MIFIIELLITVIGSIFVIFIHQYTKALTSYLLGDKAIKSSLTLNPFKYIDFIGFICMLSWGYAWGKNVSPNNSYYKDRKKGTLITYTIPILINILFAIIFYNLKFLWSGFSIIGRLNLGFAIFNLIPIYPLCGEKILRYFLTPNNSIKYMQIEPTIRVLFILFIAMGYLQVPLSFAINLIGNIISLF